MRKSKKPRDLQLCTGAERSARLMPGDFSSVSPLSPGQEELFYSLRRSVPLLDAAIYKLVHLTGGFRVECDDGRAGRLLEDFVRNVPSPGRTGLQSFMDGYFEQLLTCGTAVGEIVPGKEGEMPSLFNAPCGGISLSCGQGGKTVISVNRNGTDEPVKFPDFCFATALNPRPGQPFGQSLLSGLPFVCSVLTSVFDSLGKNWERLGNIRFAVTYKPSSDPSDRAFAKDRAMMIAREWSQAMCSGEVKDFVSVGDVQIKVIGAESTIPDSEVPVRQMLEQIVAKTGLPPYMLGLSWSTTERMSRQQADALTGELWSYRRMLESVIEKICTLFLRLNGVNASPRVVWDEITLQDELDCARAEYYRSAAQGKENEDDKEKL